MPKASKKPHVVRSKQLTPAEILSAADAIHGKIERAHKHIGELHAVLKGFLDSDPYDVIYEGDVNTGKRHVRWIEHEPLPHIVPIIAGDALHSLRSALDHLYALLVNVHGYATDRSDQFPIYDAAKAYKDAGPGIVARVGPNALRLLDSLEPYKGGCDAIWRLHRLNIIDKHRALMTVGVTGQGRRLLKDMPEESTTLTGERADPLTIAMPLPPLLKHGDILDRDIPHEKAGDEVNLTVEIALNEPGVVEAEPLVQTLDGMLEVTKRVVDVMSSLLPNAQVSDS